MLRKLLKKYRDLPVNLYTQPNVRSLRYAKKVSYGSICDAARDVKASKHASEPHLVFGH